MADLEAIEQIARRNTERRGDLDGPLWSVHVDVPAGVSVSARAALISAVQAATDQWRTDFAVSGVDVYSGCARDRGARVPKERR